MNLPRREFTVLAIGVASLAALAACGGHSLQSTAATSVPSTSQSASASASASARPVGAYPLTGRPVTNPVNAARPALSVKIDNIAGALPQSGLNQADIVSDILVEGGLTRLLATFQSQDAALIGPIRSARPVDADLLRELNGGIFAYSGAAPGEIAPSIDHSNALLVSNDHNPQWFWRSSSRAAPHNVFSSTARLYQAGNTMRPTLPTPPQLFRYSRSTDATTPASTVNLRFSPNSSAAWSWSGTAYMRTQNGAPDVLADGARVSSTNIVILSVTWHPTNIIDDAGNADPYVIVIGSGPAWVMRDGKLITGKWIRPSYRVPMRLVDATGHVIALHPGRTWLELQPQPYQPTFG